MTETYDPSISISSYCFIVLSPVIGVCLEISGRRNDVELRVFDRPTVWSLIDCKAVGPGYYDTSTIKKNINISR